MAPMKTTNALDEAWPITINITAVLKATLLRSFCTLPHNDGYNTIPYRGPSGPEAVQRVVLRTRSSINFILIVLDSVLSFSGSSPEKRSMLSECPR